MKISLFLTINLTVIIQTFSASQKRAKGRIEAETL